MDQWQGTSLPGSTEVPPEAWPASRASDSCGKNHPTGTPARLLASLQYVPLQVGYLLLVPSEVALGQES